MLTSPYQARDSVSLFQLYHILPNVLDDPHKVTT